jgi:phosphoribosylglycinamide formyltransferase-1
MPSGGTGRIAILASGEGTNLQALIDASADGLLQVDIATVVSHNPDAGALQRAMDAGISAFVTPIADRRDPAARRTLEEDLLGILLPLQLDLVILAGWMLILSADFLDRCRCPLINIHPALLPAPDLSLPSTFPILRGAHAVRDALALDLPYTGVSVHFVTPEVDAGPVILQEAVPIEPGDDEASLYRRIKDVEHRLLPRAVQHILLTHQIQGGVYA